LDLQKLKELENGISYLHKLKELLREWLPRIGVTVFIGSNPSVTVPQRYQDVKRKVMTKSVNRGRGEEGLQSTVDSPQLSQNETGQKVSTLPLRAPPRRAGCLARADSYRDIAGTHKWLVPTGWGSPPRGRAPTASQGEKGVETA
jgi:hypothetical protein